MSEQTVVRVAEFDRVAIKKYSLIQPILPLIFTVVLIPIVPLVIIGILFFIDKYLDRLSCVLTDHALELKKGIFNRVESTVPLGKITDLHMYQGPVMRYLGIHGLRVETAGQSMGAGALLTIVGVIDTPAFRKAVLEQRDRLETIHRDVPQRGATSSTEPSGDTQVSEQTALLREAVDLLKRIEQKIGQ